MYRNAVLLLLACLTSTACSTRQTIDLAAAPPSFRAEFTKRYVDGIALSLQMTNSHQGAVWWMALEEPVSGHPLPAERVTLRLIDGSGVRLHELTLQSVWGGDGEVFNATSPPLLAGRYRVEVTIHSPDFARSVSTRDLWLEPLALSYGFVVNEMGIALLENGEPDRFRAVGGRPGEKPSELLAEGEFDSLSLSLESGDGIIYYAPGGGQWMTFKPGAGERLLRLNLVSEATRTPIPHARIQLYIESNGRRLAQRLHPIWEESGYHYITHLRLPEKIDGVVVEVQLPEMMHGVEESRRARRYSLTLAESSEPMPTLQRQESPRMASTPAVRLVYMVDLAGEHHYRTIATLRQKLAGRFALHETSASSIGKARLRIGPYVGRAQALSAQRHIEHLSEMGAGITQACIGNHGIGTPRYQIQIGVFGDQANAKRIAGRLQQAGYLVRLERMQLDGKAVQRIRTVSYPTQPLAEQAGRTVERLLGIKPGIIPGC